MWKLVARLFYLHSLLKLFKINYNSVLLRVTLRVRNLKYVFGNNSEFSRKYFETNVNLQKTEIQILLKNTETVL